jgi:hypothetical protein
MKAPDTIDPKQLALIIAEAKKVAIEYYKATGRPLGITGEIAEYEAPCFLISDWLSLDRVATMQSVMGEHDCR